MCVQPPPYLGGEAAIGRREVLAIIVLGATPPDVRDRPLRDEFGFTRGAFRNTSPTGGTAFVGIDRHPA